MSKITLRIDELQSIIKFLNAFKSNTVTISCDNSSGIGAVVTATISDIELNDTRINVEKVISDHNDW